MACFQPLLAVDFGFDKESQKHKIKIIPQRADYNLKLLRSRFGSSLMMLPCGHCVACAQDYARTWQGRIMAESLYHHKSCFLTLTYKYERKPNKDDLRKFIHNLRNKFGNGIKFFACGELGSENHRFHCHAIIFGVDFSEDRYVISKRGLNYIYRSPLLESLWEYGYSSIGSLDMESAGYVSKYCDKKKISRLDEGEFVIMSRGLGKQYFLDHADEIFSSDYIYFNGNKFKIPRYFLTLAAKASFLVQIDADDYKTRRREVACSFRYDQNRSFSVEELAMKENESVVLSKYKKEESFRDVI